MCALAVAGGIANLIMWALQEERPFWIQGLTAAILIIGLIIYPAVLLMSSWLNVNPYQPYDDSPVQTMDRYS